MNRIVVPQRFREIIQIHVLRNVLKQDTASVPLFLGIHGRPGDGKTFQCLTTLEDFGIAYLLMSGGQYESARSAEPARLLTELYLEAGRLLATGEFQATVLVLNDIDTGLGKWEGIVQYTVNRQNLLGALMHLSDSPTFVAGSATQRVPIIVTGNDFTKLYEPLRRSGRMQLFEWKSEPGERAAIVSELFPTLTEEECERLVDSFPDQPVSFFSDIRSRSIDMTLLCRIQQHGFNRALSSACNSSMSDFIGSYDLTTLLSLGSSIAASIAVSSHLGGSA